MNKKTRLVRGTTGKVFHRLFSKNKYQYFCWGKSLKPGDTFNSFDSWNHVVERVKIVWREAGFLSSMKRMIPDKQEKNMLCLKKDPNCLCSLHFLRGVSGMYVYDICLFSTNGMCHSFLEGCIEPTMEVDKLIKIFGKKVFDEYQEKQWIDSKGFWIKEI